MVNASFDCFLSQTVVPPEELARARSCAVTVALALRAGLRPTLPEASREDFLICGSVGKRTAIRPLPAVDLLYVLPAWEGPAQPVVERMAAVLAAAFPDHRVHRFAAGCALALDQVPVAVIPAIEHQGAFRVPLSPAGAPDGWRLSNPVAEAAALRLAESTSGGRVLGLLALLKAWRQHGAVAIGSLALELLACRFLAEAPRPAAWADCLADFFAWSRRIAPRQLEMPGGLGHIDAGTDWHGAAEAAYWRCILARQSQEEWQKLFGPDFPLNDGVPP